MLDIKMIRENPENIRKMLKDRDVQFDLDLLLEENVPKMQCSSNPQ